MPDQIYIGKDFKGKNLYKQAFNIDNDAFETLYNFYSWRGTVKRKRGTALLGQLQRQIQSVLLPNNWQQGGLVLVGGVGNLITGFSLEASSSIAPGTITVTVGADTYTDPLQNGTLFKNAVLDPGSEINYATGKITIAGGGLGPLIGTFSYYPGLPVMGLRDFVSAATLTFQYPIPLDFDTKYSYQLNQTDSNDIFFYNTTFYKITQTPFTWSGADYQQFWTTNYQSALWATNNNPGFHFVDGTYISGSGTTIIYFNFKSGGVNYTDLVIGDRLWFNEWNTGGSTINGEVGVVSDITGAAAGNYGVTFTSVQIVAGTGIAQLLTASIDGQDGIRWYDGDPTTNGLPSNTGLGWVNFSPPLTATSVSINDKTAGLYYLVGALAIVPFKDRLLFFSPFIQTSTGSPILLYDTVIWSWNGTPYYSIAPANETVDITAFYVDQAGKGGYLSAGISQPINTISSNEDALLVGFGGNGRKTRFVYSGNDIQPFLFFTINSELPSSSTFSSITLDRGAIDLGPYGFALTDQQSSQRIDLEIPDEVFQIKNLEHGIERVNAIRDFLKEWIYFCYPVNDSSWKFPTQSFMYNYRDNTWALLYENYTAHGRYRQQVKNTWVSIGRKFGSWAAWRQPWNSPATAALYANIIAGTPQGYVIIKDQGTSESVSGTITAISDFGDGKTQITSINHCVEKENPFLLTGDYLYFTGSIGNTFLNGLIGKVIRIIDADNFVIDIDFVAGAYLGLGKFSRLSQPLLQTKQFNFYWEQGRKVRLCAQKYLMDFTSNSQVTVNIYLSQDDDSPWNEDPEVPDGDTTNSALIYSQLLYTCPESSNLGLTPANTNLQMPTASTQKQIWHRMNTSLQGDSVQIGLTLSDAQMRNLTYATSEIGLHAIHLTVTPGSLLA